MLSGLRWLTLEVKYLDRAREFYESHLDLPVRETGDGEVAFAAGDHRLVLRETGNVRRESGRVPRGGLHTHYAFSTPDEQYDAWFDRLSSDFDLVEHSFGAAQSLYFYDPDGNCVEIGTGGEGDGDITGIFEIVLEVEDLPSAESFYADLGFETFDRGEKRRRVRMGGPVDLELWEPHLGIADARGGVHVDVGFAADDPDATAARVEDRACSVESVEDDDHGVRVRDPDGHYLTIR